MFPISTKSAGMAFAFPDTCKVPAPPAPPVPTPFPNVGQCASAMLTSVVVKILGMPVITMMSEIPVSMGDEAGVGGGVISAVTMSKIAFRAGSASVLVEGSPPVCLMHASAHNGANANAPMGMIQVPSQTFVLAAK